MAKKIKRKIFRVLKIPLFFYFYSKKENEGGKENFGDVLSLYIVKKISRRPIFIVNPYKFLIRNFIKHYFAIGSIISKSNAKTVVWGAGIIRESEKIKGGEFIAVRGPRTKERIESLGFSCTSTYGDPAILSPLFYTPKVEKIYDIGIIPHYVDYDSIQIFIKNNNLSYKNYKIINLLNDDVENVIDDIARCKRIISSSLHGVIVSHTYQIPALWVRFSEKLVGDDVKFYDYFESIGLEYKKTFTLKDFNGINKIFKENNELILPKKDIIEQLSKQLLEVCPF